MLEAARHHVGTQHRGGWLRRGAKARAGDLNAYGPTPFVGVATGVAYGGR